MIDFYFDSKNNILKNKFNITDYTKLKEVEYHYYYLGIKKLSAKPYFSVETDYIGYLHNLFFYEVYDWAGKYRLIDIDYSWVD